jgi:hypothetical protein
MAGLLAPIEVGLLCGLSDGGGERLTLAYCRVRFEACCGRCVAQRVQSVGKRAGR